MREVKRDRETRTNATTKSNDKDHQIYGIDSSVVESVQNSEFNSESSEFNSEFNCHCNEECPDSDDDLQNVKEDVLSTMS